MARWQRTRAQGWLARGPFGYMTLDREAGEFFLRTRSAIFPGMKIAEIFGVTEGPLYEQMARNILHVNGADHSRLRSLVNPALSPRAVERYRPAMREFLGGLLEDALAAPRAAGGEVPCDFVETFARPYPSQVIATVMGAPLEDAPRLHHWSNWIQKQFDAASMASELPTDRGGGRRVLRVRTGALVADRRRSPADDLISRLDPGRGAGRPALGRRVHQPRLQRARRRRRHDTGAARARDQAAGRTPRPVGGPAAPTLRSPRKPSRRRCATSRSRPSRRGS